MRNTIILVDDDDSLRGFLRMALEKADITVADFNNGIDAIAHLENNTADLMLTDIIMPIMDGFELSQSAKSIAPNMPVIYMSGFSAMDKNTENDQTFIAKPFHLNDIVTRVKETLAKPLTTP
jgi:two-component system cell cycle response regulator CpdR